MGCRSVDLTKTVISKEDFNGLENLYVLAGLGGKTGSGYITNAISVAKNSGILNLSVIVTMPFCFEGENKVAKAKESGLDFD